MAKAKFLQENIACHVAPVGVITSGADMFNGNPVTTPISMRYAAGAVYDIITMSNAEGSAVVTVLACTANGTTASTAIPFKYQVVTSVAAGAVTDATTTGFGTSTGADLLYRIEVDAADVRAAGQEYVEMVCTESDNAAVHGAIVATLINTRYKPLSAD